MRGLLLFSEHLLLVTLVTPEEESYYYFCFLAAFMYGILNFRFTRKLIINILVIQAEKGRRESWLKMCARGVDLNRIIIIM